MSTSATEAEYIASAESAKECIWLRALLAGLGFPQPHATVMRVDSTSAMKLSPDAMFHSRVQHLDVKWHYLREVVASGHIAIQYIPSHLNVADAFTKALYRKAFQTLHTLMGLRAPVEEE